MSTEFDGPVAQALTAVLIDELRRCEELRRLADELTVSTEWALTAINEYLELGPHGFDFADTER